MQIESLYNRAKMIMDKDYLSARKLFEQIIQLIGDKPISVHHDNELRILALSYKNLFLISRLRDDLFATKSIEAFEMYFKKNYLDTEMYDSYILLLELTYQYRKSNEILNNLLANSETKELALKYLSSIVYQIEGLQTLDDCVNYKQQLIEMSRDEHEKARLQKELITLKERNN